MRLNNRKLDILAGLTAEHIEAKLITVIGEDWIITQIVIEFTHEYLKHTSGIDLAREVVRIYDLLATEFNNVSYSPYTRELAQEQWRFSPWPHFSIVVAKRWRPDKELPTDLIQTDWKEAYSRAEVATRQHIDSKEKSWGTYDQAWIMILNARDVGADTWYLEALMEQNKPTGERPY